MKYAIRNFSTFEQFEDFLNRMNTDDDQWRLHSWQDIGHTCVAIRAVFSARSQAVPLINKERS